MELLPLRRVRDSIPEAGRLLYSRPGMSLPDRPLDGAGLAFVEVRGGAFAMGSTSGRPDEAPVHEVEVQSFRIARTPVTRAQYTAFLAESGSETPPWWDAPAFSDPDQPVVGVTWFDAVRFAEWVSLREGGVYRLPTEAEWEHAARGKSDYPPPEVPKGPLAAPWRVGTGEPNAYGAFDLGTIVHEWCADWYRADYYAVSPRRDPRGPEEGERRASRGGSWRHHVRFSPPSARSSLHPERRYADYGFRLLLE
jgi:formylglycine-generating enzyme required for sulfatase activity